MKVLEGEWLVDKFESSNPIAIGFKVQSSGLQIRIIRVIRGFKIYISAKQKNSYYRCCGVFGVTSLRQVYQRGNAGNRHG